MLTKQQFLEGSIDQHDLWGDHLATLEERLDRPTKRKAAKLRQDLKEVRRAKRRLKARLRCAQLEPEEHWSSLRDDLNRKLDAFRRHAHRVYREVQ